MVLAKQPFETPHEGDELVRAARRKIDGDIDRLERAVQSLRTKRNELSPTSVLPPEILSRIFVLARDWSVRVEFNNRVSWICVGHVCHHWREVALGCPSLWSVPVFSRPNLAQEMLQRSKMAALTIRSTASHWTPEMFETLETAMGQIHRIQSIELDGLIYPGVVKILSSSLSQPATLLEDISLSGAAHLMPLRNQSLFTTDALTDAPRLRSVSFYRLNVSWESAVFRHRNLTCLRLSNSPVAVGSASTFGQMMDALNHLPNIRILELSDSIPSHTTSKGDEKILEFKFLERLELSAKAVDCTLFLRHIRYPPRATVILHSSSTATETGETVLSLIGQNLCRTQSAEAGVPLSPFVIQSVRLTSTDLGNPEITFFNNLFSVKHLNGPSGIFGPFIKLCLSGGFGFGGGGGLLMSLFNSFDLSSLQGLLLDQIFTDNETHIIQDTFGKLPKLKIIHVSRYLPRVCRAITENSKDVSAPRRKELPQNFPPITIFPALRTFVVENVDFRRRYFSETTDCLVDMLMWRSNINMPIDRLSPEQCRGVRIWQQRQLGELVVDLEVEGDVIDVRELDSDDGMCDEGDDSDEDEYGSDDSHIDCFLFDPVFIPDDYLYEDEFDYY